MPTSFPGSIIGNSYQTHRGCCNTTAGIGHLRYPNSSRASPAPPGPIPFHPIAFFPNSLLIPPPFLHHSNLIDRAVIIFSWRCGTSYSDATQITRASSHPISIQAEGRKGLSGIYHARAQRKILYGISSLFFACFPDVKRKRGISK